MLKIVSPQLSQSVLYVMGHKLGSLGYCAMSSANRWHGWCASLKALGKDERCMEVRPRGSSDAG